MQKQNVKIEKVVVNIGLSEIARDKKVKEQILTDLAIITGQKPVLTKAKKSIAGFKIRQGMEIGAKITLRGQKMQDFINRLVRIALPRTRDFHGIEQKSFDSRGNLTIGIKEHIIFPEISPEDVKQVFGFEITIVTSAKTDKQAIKFLKLLGFPIKNGS